MTKYLVPLIVVTTLAASTHTLPASQDESNRPQGDESRAVALEREVERLATTNAGERALWPGFDPLSVPLAVYDGERTLLFRHPAAPQGFEPVSDAAPPTYAWNGRHEAMTANTSAEVGGVATATLLLDRSQPERSLLDLAAVAIHEAFHVYQRAHHPGWIANEADLFTYPMDAADLLALRRLETEALRRALAADEATDAACWARQALGLRKERYARMEPAFAAYERGTELNEGLAAYVEMRAAGRRAVDLLEGEFGPTEVRLRAYAIGPALALLLDRFLPSWAVTFEANDRQTLDEALAAALAEGEVCGFGDAALAEAELKARADVAALAAERARRVVEFEGKPGWRVVVEVGGGEPLRPQGFDPLNVERVGGERVLHRRFLRLGNGGGRLEVLNAEALTEGAGSHPLFQGVRRMVVTGLAEPEVKEVDGKVMVRAPGLTVELTGAGVTRSGEVVTVRLGSP